MRNDITDVIDVQTLIDFLNRQVSVTDHIDDGWYTIGIQSDSDDDGYSADSGGGINDTVKVTDQFGSLRLRF